MYNVAFYFVIVIGFVPLFFHKYWNRADGVNSIRCIVPFLWLIIISAIYESIASWALALNSDIYFRIYVFLEFSALFYFSKVLLKERFNTMLLSSACIFITAYIYFCFAWKSYKASEADSILTVFETIFIYIVAICWFKRIFEELEATNIFKLPEFYFISGLLVYFSGTLFLFIFREVLSDVAGNHFKDFWILNILFGIILRILFICGVWTHKRRFTHYSG